MALRHQKVVTVYWLWHLHIRPGRIHLEADMVALPAGTAIQISYQVEASMTWIHTVVASGISMGREVDKSAGWIGSLGQIKVEHSARTARDWEGRLSDAGHRCLATHVDRQSRNPAAKASDRRVNPGRN